MLSALTLCRAPADPLNTSLSWQPFIAGGSTGSLSSRCRSTIPSLKSPSSYNNWQKAFIMSSKKPAASPTIITMMMMMMMMILPPATSLMEDPGKKTKPSQSVVSTRTNVNHEEPHSSSTPSVSPPRNMLEDIRQVHHPLYQSRQLLLKTSEANVVKGLKLYEDVFTGTQLSKLLDSINQLREAGRNHQLSGETFVLFNKNTKGTKRELLQLGVPIFGNTTDEHSVEPIPTLVQSVIDHLLQWRVIPEYKRPNGCVINFFDEDEHSQPFQKPPHVDQPISTLVLSESTMVFGHRLGVDNDGNFRGSLTLPLKEGSLLVMRGNSADMARHVMCPSPNKRVAITFFKLKPDSGKVQPPPTLWRPGTPAPPACGMVIAPLVMLAPAPKRIDAGTGVFLPWTPPVTRKPTKHLPPRVQRLRLLSSAKPVADREASSPEIGVS
ncbi:uncharacterized protein LOC9318213 isoform X2 [Arabidopsis lyrata subsp. lyrata]|uniref:uncharacterized protein LOC9318213 isoform X2 n=1 Tax=Arabidopsis lyrata subsp. lyrata TaxID=81972 RepID=UPI000A29DB23|nr:uncharacterized protein LOC9318213 isoform X2 [Arabidopsis lyrata subsp. lyrata]|eukprot:XP_020885099.1 uncharacterized protein LOC9318213 isoform X2 [Arabidopsis lyrata subsp. lyrata]